MVEQSDTAREDENSQDASHSLTIPNSEADQPAAKPKRGRPTNKSIAKAKKPGKVGRPAGQAAKIAEMRARLIVTDGPKVMAKIISKAMDDADGDQAAMLKLAADILKPALNMGEFSGGQGGGGTFKVEINVADPNAGVFMAQQQAQREAEQEEIEDAIIVEADVAVSGSDDSDSK